MLTVKFFFCLIIYTEEGGQYHFKCILGENNVTVHK